MVLNPYELHARSVCSSAALLLADPVITLLPAPLEGLDPAHIAQAMLDSPGFERLMDTWSWASALWRHGALTAGIGGVTPIGWVQQAAADIAGGSDAAGPAGAQARTLAKLVGQTRFDHTPRYLDAVCRDLERGGGDPAVSVPINVGLERYSATIAAPLAVSPTESVVSRLERRQQRPFLRLTTTVVHGASGTLLAELRDALDDELHAFRRRLADVLSSRSGSSGDDLRDAGDALEDAINALPDGVLGPRDDDERRVRGGVRRTPVSLTFGLDHEGGALSVAQQAAALVGAPRRRGVGGRQRSKSRGSTPAGAAQRAEAIEPTAALARRPVLRLTIKPLPYASA